MRRQLIYVDINICKTQSATNIESELGRSLVYRLPEKTWNVNDALATITDPRIELAVINYIDEIAIMEVALLHFLCKPILVTAKGIEEYEILKRTVDHIEIGANLRYSTNTFIKWFKLWKGIE